jgi:two-component system CheB/CheR fusion protein
VTTVEREVRGHDQGWYQLRIRSYKDHDNRIDGAVLSLLDIAKLKASEREAVQARRLADELLQAIEKPLALLTGDGRLRSANLSFVRVLGLRGEEAVGRRLEELVPKEWDGARLRGLIGKRPRRRGLQQVAIPGDGDGGTARRLAARRIEIEGDEVVLLTVET